MSLFQLKCGRLLTLRKGWLLLPSHMPRQGEGKGCLPCLASCIWGLHLGPQRCPQFPMLLHQSQRHWERHWAWKGKFRSEPKETKQPFSLSFLLSDDIHLLCLSARHMHRVYPCPVSEQSCRGDPVICAWWWCHCGSRECTISRFHDCYVLEHSAGPASLCSIWVTAKHHRFFQRFTGTT